jgi:hypothetical protein
MAQSIINLFFYADFLKEVIDSSNRTLLCSQDFHALVKMMFRGKHSLDAYFKCNPDKLFSLSNEDLKLSCHPKYLSNRKFNKSHKVEYAEKSNQQFNNIREYFNIHSVCTDGVDMVSLRRGTPAYELLLRKEKEQAERNSICQKNKFAKGEGTLQLAAAKELRQ